MKSNHGRIVLTTSVKLASVQIKTPYKTIGKILLFCMAFYVTCFSVNCNVSRSIKLFCGIYVAIIVKIS